MDSMYQLQQFASKSVTPLYYYIYYGLCVLASTICLKMWLLCITINNMDAKYQLQQFASKCDSSVLLYILWITCTSSNNLPDKMGLLCITIYRVKFGEMNHISITLFYNLNWWSEKWIFVHWNEYSVWRNEHFL